MYFSKKQYEAKPLPVFEATRGKLPSPIFDEDPNYLRCYWKAWELAFRNFHEPAKGTRPGATPLLAASTMDKGHREG